MEGGVLTGLSEMILPKYVVSKWFPLCMFDLSVANADKPGGFLGFYGSSCANRGIYEWHVCGSSANSGAGGRGSGTLAGLEIRSPLCRFTIAVPSPSHACAGSLRFFLCRSPSSDPACLASDTDEGFPVRIANR